MERRGCYKSLEEIYSDNRKLYGLGCTERKGGDAMRKKLLTILLCTQLAFFAAGCSQNTDDLNEDSRSSSSSSLEWPIDSEGNGTIYFDAEEGDCHVTSAVLIENGKARSLTKEEYLKLTETGYTQQLEAEFAGSEELRVFQVQKQYDVQNMLRLNALFNGINCVDVLPAAFSSYILTDEQTELSDEQTAAINETLCGTYKVKKEGSIDKQDGRVLFVSGNFRFSTVAFIPCMEVIQGSYHDEEDIGITAYYPYVDEGGFLNGIAVMIESDKATALRDL